MSENDLSADRKTLMIVPVHRAVEAVKDSIDAHRLRIVRQFDQPVIADQGEDTP